MAYRAPVQAFGAWQERRSDRPSCGDVTALLDAMVGGGRETPKLACGIASMIEQRLIRGEYHVGDMLGSEQGLAERFDVCRVVIREAARILQAHGTARTRPGPNGGLILTRPHVDHAVELALRYVDYHCSDRRQASEASQIVDLVANDIAQAGGHALADGPGIRLILDLLQGLAQQAGKRLTAHAPPIAPYRADVPSRIGLGRTRAMQLANELMRDARACASEGKRLGSELDLSEQYQVDRSVLRQAIRILEAEGSVASVAGRGNGLMLCEPEMAPACWLIHCVFTTHHVTVEASITVFMHLSTRMAALAAERATPPDIERMRHALERLQSADDGDYPSALLDMEHSLFKTVANPLLLLMLVPVRSFAAWRIGDQKLLWRNRKIHTDATAAVLEAIASGRPAAAAHAQREKFAVLGTAWPRGEQVEHLPA